MDAVPQSSSESPLEDEDFTPRPYQVHLYEKAKDQNAILFLPTGTGKTLIAMMLIKHKSHAFKLPYEQGGKRIIINVPTKSLAEQHRDTFRNTITSLSEFKAEVFTGDDIDENWTEAFWYPKICASHVLIMPGEVHRSLITHNLLPLNRVELIIFDECHHANQEKNHPYVLIMDEVRKMTDEKPQIFGMTPCIINKQCPPHLIPAEVKKLEKSLDNAKVISSDDVMEINAYGATPDIEPAINFDPVSTNDPNDAKLLESYLEYLNRVDSLLDNESLSQLLLRKFKSLLFALQRSIESMGLWAVHQLSEIVSSDITSFIGTNSAQNKSECEVLLHIKKLIDSYIKLLNIRLESEPDPYRRLIKFASPKMRGLLNCLAEYQPGSPLSSERLLRGIIFVKEKKNVFLICLWLKKVAESLALWSFLKVGYVVGQTSTISEIKSSRSSQKNVLAMFRTGQLNLIISTSVLEEGIDVPQCNLVIRYDFPATYREFVQSKGRARSPGSRFLFFVPLDEPNFVERGKNLDLIREYMEIEKSLENIHHKPVPRNPFDYDTGYETILKKKYDYSTDSGAHLTHNSAISIVNRYCSSLPSDSITSSTPKVEIIEVRDPSWTASDPDPQELPVWYQCSLRLPINSPLRRTINGDIAKTKKVAKKLAAFKACVELHQLKELDDHLLPIGKKCIQSLCDDLGLEPYEEEYLDVERDKRLGTTKSRNSYTKLTADIFSGPPPTAQQPCFLYIFAIKLTSPLPDHLNTRGTRLFDPASRESTFGILVPHRLPQVCDFKLFTRSGEVTVTLIKAHNTYTLEEDFLRKIKNFHRYIFHSFLGTAPAASQFNTTESNTNHLLVPVVWSAKWNQDDSTWSSTFASHINWKMIEKINLLDHSSLTDSCTSNITTTPCSASKETFVFSSDDFTDAVVKRQYNDPSQKKDAFYVINVDHEQNPLSPLAGEDNAKSGNCDYFSYYKNRYKIEIVNLQQPLLDVDYVSPHLNLLTCRFDEESRNRKKGSKSRSKCFLVPELCSVHPLPAGYYRLTFMLPSILYRLNTIYRAEQLRSIIAKATNIGPASFAKWPLLASQNQADQSVTRSGDGIESTDSSPSSGSDQVIGGFIDSGILLNENPPANENDHSFQVIPEEHLRIEISKAFCKSISPYYEESIYSVKRKQNTEESPVSGEQLFATSTGDQTAAFGGLLAGYKRQKLESVPECHLKFDELKESLGQSEGPDPNEILKALTLAKAGELVNLERLEMVGDSFLKYAVSVFTFCSSRVHEGLLSELRSRQSSNYHLFRLGKRKQLPGYMIASKFEPKRNWLPPGFCVDEAEQESGPFTQQQMDDKSIADCVEALIGAYLMNSGSRGALYFMRWLGLKVMHDGHESDCNPDPDDRIWHHMPPVASPVNCDLDPVVRDALIDKLYTQTSLDQFERSVLRYEFKDKAFLIQAFTHSSYFDNQLTDCYQRLEFLGDAVLDYLVTRMLYDDSKKHSPGTLTDLRSALVNNIFFASLAVEYQFHKYLKNTSHDLWRVINNFVNSSLAKEVSSAESSGLRGLYRANADTIAHCESDTLLGDVEVPKALGDIFESVAGAIFLDSGMSLDEVWRVYYPMMKPEIEHFANNIPISPIRELFELKQVKAEFTKSIVSPGTVEVSVILNYEKPKKFTAIKSTKKAAKLEAAKMALHYVKSSAA